MSNGLGTSWWCSSVLLVGVLACRAQPAASTHRDSEPPLGNMTRDDFAGSDACAGCHAEIYARWRASPMHRMTRRMLSGVARAPFDGAEFQFKSDRARMVTERGQHYMHIQSAQYGDDWYRVTKVIGGRYREDYAGRRVAAPNADAAASGDERILPVSYLLFNEQWRYKGYSVLSPERDGLKRGLKWRKSCIFCHNTAPWLSLYYDELYGVGAPGYQGAASLKLPRERQLNYQLSDFEALASAIAGEFQALGQSAPGADEPAALLEEAAATTSRHFGESHLVEVGIGCEACHGGARAHAAAPRRSPSYLPQSDFLAVTTAQGGQVPKALAISHSCAKCHTVLFSRYEHTWEGGTRGFNPGGSNMNSGEARNFLLGACTSELTCTSCHDPHAEDDPRAAERLATVDGNGVCTRCHEQLADKTALERHTHHTATGKGSACIGCHMPEKNLALNYRLTRYHRIGSPTDSERVERDRPLECALCHADKSVLELVSFMEKAWNKSYDRAALQRLYGADLRRNTLAATLERGKPHEQAVAVFVSGASKAGASSELLLQQLTHEYPLIRFFARDALERRYGRDLPLEMHASGSQLKAEAERLLEIPKAPSERGSRHAAD